MIKKGIIIGLILGLLAVIPLLAQPIGGGGLAGGSPYAIGIIKDGDVDIDAISSTADTTVYIKNSDGTYVADLNVEGAIIAGGTDISSTYLKLDQTTPQTVSNGAPLFDGGIASSGDLKIMPDVQGDVIFFGDTDMHDSSQGRSLKGYRMNDGAVGDEYFRLYIDSAGGANLYTSSVSWIVNPNCDDSYPPLIITNTATDISFNTNINVSGVGHDMSLSGGTGGFFTAYTGGALNLTGGSSAGSGNADGGAVNIAGGTGRGTGVQGNVVITGPVDWTGITGDIDIGTNAFTTTGSGTFGNITIFNPIPILVFKDSTYVGDVSLGYIEWRDRNNTRLGFFGNSSSGNDDLYWVNESSGGHIVIQTTGAGEVQILANVDLGSGNLTTTGILTQGGTVFTPSAAQVIDAVGDTILANATVIVLNPDADRTLTSTPTIANGTTGQILYITCANGEAHTVTIQDAGTLANSNLELGGATRGITGKSVLTLLFDGTNWIEVSYQIA